MKNEDVNGRSLDIEEVRLVSDLRIMHARVAELWQEVNELQRRHGEDAVVRYADQPLLDSDIERMDQIYLWFVKLKEHAMRTRKLG